MATENNKNIKYQSRDSIRPKRKKLTDSTVKNVIKNNIISFINAVKQKHFN